MEVTIYGKKECGLCDSAKEKMGLLGVGYKFVDLMQPGDQWRKEGVAEARAYYESLDNQTLPIMCLDGKHMLLPMCVKTIKEMNKQRKVQDENRTIRFSEKVSNLQQVCIAQA